MITAKITNEAKKEPGELLIIPLRAERSQVEALLSKSRHYRSLQIACEQNTN